MTTKTLMMLSDMWKRGLGPDEMAEALGMNKWSIWTYIQRHRDLFPHRRHHIDWWRERLKDAEGLNGVQAARKLGVSEHTVSYWRRRVADDRGPR